MTAAAGRIALVTGAGKGIGRAVAVDLSRRGARVVLTARSKADLSETAASCVTETLIVPADITDPGTPEVLWSTVEEAWGSVDILVANAGAGVSAKVQRTSDEDWQAMLDVNLTAPFRCLRRALPSMLAADWGRVVAVASVAAKVGEPYIAAYTASKHGVLGLVRSAAAEVASTGVTVNAICPGYVDTPMTDATVAGIVSRTGRSAEEARAILAAKQPSGRLVTTGEVAEAVWMCVADGTVNGEGVDVDGGA